MILEDIVNTQSRSKLEEFDDYLSLPMNILGVDLDSNEIVETRVDDTPRYDANAFAKTDQPTTELPNEQDNYSTENNISQEDKIVHTLDGEKYEIEEIPAKELVHEKAQ